MAAPTPNNWRTSIVNLAISALVVAIALHIAVELVRTVAPELITRIRRSRW
jgi:hypothetical protein